MGIFDDLSQEFPEVTEWEKTKIKCPKCKKAYLWHKVLQHAIGREFIYYCKRCGYEEKENEF